MEMATDQRVIVIQAVSIVGRKLRCSFTFNQGVPGSIPGRPTKIISKSADLGGVPCPRLGNAWVTNAFWFVRHADGIRSGQEERHPSSRRCGETCERSSL